MKLIASTLMLAVALAGCSEDNAQKTASTLESSNIKPPAREHNYDFSDGAEYGYTQAQTAGDAQNGVAANEITMVKYAGEKEGRHQIHINQGALLIAIECTHPCEVAKIMAIMDLPSIPPSTMNVERVRFSDGAIGALALEDAARGELRQYYRDLNNKKYSVWVDQEKGVVLTQ